jgi:hypothetical protein
MPETIGIISGIAVQVLLFKPFFGNARGFWDSIGFWIGPDIVSLCRGDWGEDPWPKIKFTIWLVSGVWVGFVVYAVVSKLFG